MFIGCLKNPLVLWNTKELSSDEEYMCSELFLEPFLCDKCFLWMFLSCSVHLVLAKSIN